MRAAIPAVALALALLTTLGFSTEAIAAWGNFADETDGAQLISADYQRLEQGDDTTEYAAISADGRYVAIQTLARNLFADGDPDPPALYRKGGIFRFDLETKALEKVADGSLFDEAGNEFVRLGAARPSISADGRYVAFATPESLVAADTNDNLDVYVRDMDVAIGQPGDYDLVSARDGGDQPAQYGAPAFPLPGSEPGANVSRGVAISADGGKVVFRTEAPSDLPSSAGLDTPPGQVFVRDRLAETTTLVTAKRDPGSGEMTSQPAGGAVGAGLSADGTTVAWTGGNAAEQTRILGGENADPTFLYYLWRRVADGSPTPTRRITGLSDPDDPGCVSPPASYDRTTTGPCYGPLTDQEGIPADLISQVPAISADGYTVAFLTGAAARPLITANPGLDLFVTDMTPGVSRKQATVELTRDTLDNDLSTAPPVSSVAISPEGRYLVITSARTKFVFPALQQLGEPRAVPGPGEAYVVDLQASTLERVVHSSSGTDSDGGVAEGATISAGGGRVAFSSFAGNLFYGDSNQRPDAFVATRVPDPEGGPAEKGRGEGGAGATIEVEPGGPQIGVKARSKPGGAILLSVSVPAAGGVRAVAKAHAGTPPKLRTLATANGRAGGATRSTVTLTLRPVARYMAELRHKGEIAGHALVGYVASRGGRHANVSVPVVFRLTVGSKRSARGGKRAPGVRRSEQSVTKWRRFGYLTDNDL